MTGLVLRVAGDGKTSYVSPQLVTIKNPLQEGQNLTFFQPLNAIDSLIATPDGPLLTHLQNIIELTPVENVSKQTFVDLLELNSRVFSEAEELRGLLATSVGANLGNINVGLEIDPTAINSYFNLQIKINRNPLEFLFSPEADVPGKILHYEIINRDTLVTPAKCLKVGSFIFI